jgi:hypothetical protein
MSLSFFADKARPPSDAELAECLGSAHALWTQVREHVASKARITAVWGYTSRSTGWGLRLKSGERVILYMTPREGEFLASTALGEKAIANARGLPPAVRRLIADAPRYAEGRGIRITVKRPSDVRSVAHVVALKVEGPAPR